MVFSSYGNASSCYLPLDSDQGVTFYKNENALFSPQPPTSVVCRRNQDNNNGGAMQPFGNNSHGTVVVDAVRQDFQPVAHLSSNGYYGYVPPSQNSTASVNAGTVNVQLETPDADAAMDCGGGEMENFQQLQQQQQQLQRQRKRKEYGEEAADCKRRKTWLEEEQQQQGFAFGWNALPYAPQQQQPQQHQMDCHEDAASMMMAHQAPVDQTIIAATNNNGCFQVQLTPVIPVAMVQPTPVPQHQQQPPKSKYLESSRCMMSHMI